MKRSELKSIIIECLLEENKPNKKNSKRIIENQMKFSEDQLDKLRVEFSKINTVDPTAPAYKKFHNYLGGLSKDQLKQLKEAKPRIKWLSNAADIILRYSFGG